MGDLMLICHDRAGRDEPGKPAPVVSTVAEGHPPIPDVLAELRIALCNDVSDGCVMWWHRHGQVWGAVLELHRQARHERATDLAKVLLWCDLQGSPQTADALVWEIRAGRPSGGDDR